jgi:phage terminase small subunit
MAARRATKAPAPTAPTPPTPKKSAKKDALRPGQERFAQEFVKSNNATDAYQIAYPKTKYSTAMANGSRLLRHAKVALRVAELQAEVARANGIDAIWVTRRLKEISDRCMQSEPILDADGEPTGKFRFDAAGANRATELLGKSIGMFSERLRLDVRDVSSLTDAELEEERRRLGGSR